MIKIIEKWRVWLLLSALVIVPGIIALFSWGLNFGIDFKGGTILEMRFPQVQKIEVEKVREVFNEKEIKNANISLTADNAFLARSHFIEYDRYQELKTALNEKIGESKETQFETVGPTVSGTLSWKTPLYALAYPLKLFGLPLPSDYITKAFTAIFWASIMIILYVAWAFRSVPKPLSSWKFGVSAVIALIHDLMCVIGIFAVLGHFKGVEVDTLFITALLTILGFSVHDTIVVFDRIRENLRTTSGDLKHIANKSILETTARSLNTSATILFTLLALFLFGGASIMWFVFALLIGIIVGTYSSIFVASTIMVLWHKNVKI